MRSSADSPAWTVTSPVAVASRAVGSSQVASTAEEGDRRQGQRVSRGQRCQGRTEITEPVAMATTAAAIRAGEALREEATSVVSVDPWNIVRINESGLTSPLLASLELFPTVSTRYT